MNCIEATAETTSGVKSIRAQHRWLTKAPLSGQLGKTSTFESKIRASDWDVRVSNNQMQRAWLVLVWGQPVQPVPYRRRATWSSACSPGMIGGLILCMQAHRRLCLVGTSAISTQRTTAREIGTAYARAHDAGLAPKERKPLRVPTEPGSVTPPACGWPGPSAKAPYQSRESCMWWAM